MSYTLSGSWLTVAVMGAALAMTPAVAQESIGERVLSGVGLIIADQGNRALHQIEDEFKQQLLTRLKPVLPQPRHEVLRSAPAPAVQRQG